MPLIARLAHAFVLSLGLLLCHAAQAQGGEAAVIAQRLLPGERIRVTGRLDHPAWQRAPVFADFVQKAPEVGTRPSHETRVRVLFDEHALYVGIEALDDDPSQIRAPLVRHDQVNRTQDFVVVYVDAIGRRQSAQFFRVNAAGSTADGMHTAADDSEDFAPDFDFDAAASRNDQGYTVVMRIPFASLRFSSEGRPAWRFMVARRVPRSEFYMNTSVLIPREAPSFIAALQPLQGVELPERHQFLTLRPSLTWRTQRQSVGDAPAERRSSLDATLDLKWRPMPEWVIDATLNPDFSQVALDVPQLAGNQRFALSFPEKRPFFFESSDLLRSPTEAIYTRSFTEPRWGLRSTWRGRTLAGSAFAIDDRGGGLVLLPGAYGTGVAEQPASTALVARLKQDTGALQWGALAVSRRYADDRGANQVIGPDLAWQLSDYWRLRAQWLASDTTAWADAQGQLRRGPSRSGHQGLLRTTRQSDESELTLTLTDSSEAFRHDTGFVVQNGVRSANLFAGKGWTPLGVFNEFWVNLHVDQASDRATGQRVSRDIYPGIWFGGAHNLEGWLHWHGWSTLRTSSASPLLAERYLKGEVIFTPAAWLPFVTLDARAGRIADVVADAVRRGGDFSLTLTTRPHARLEFEPRWSVAWLERDGERAYRETAAQVLAVWHFDAAQTLRAIVQRTTLERRAEPGVAAARDAGTQGSLTYAWRRSAGTVLYAGLSRSRQGLAQLARGNEFFIKLQVDAEEVAGLFRR